MHWSLAEAAEAPRQGGPGRQLWYGICSDWLGLACPLHSTLPPCLAGA